MVTDDEPADPLVSTVSAEFQALDYRDKQFIIRLNNVRSQLCPGEIRSKDQKCLERMNELKAEVTSAISMVEYQEDLKKIDKRVTFLELRVGRLFESCGRYKAATSY